MAGLNIARHLPTFLVLLAYFTIIRAQVPAVGGDPRVGTWKLNLKESQFTPGAGPEQPKMLVRRVQSRPDGFVVFTQIGLDSQDNPLFIQTIYKLDGKNYPEYTQTSLAEFAAADTTPSLNAYRRVDAYTVEITRFDAVGKVTGTSTQVLSKDGKTHIATGRDPSGKVLSRQVWERQ
jgi:hypothetical protein